ncbi:Cof-type HAD-IIB family hydrolase [Novosphingobium sp.]|uniref:Cof-type HAD-IIB family hydrolase n=1 Tax=Novosphingobium sp. TaxID=1874826 RepID=UPI003B52737A
MSAAHDIGLLLSDVDGTLVSNNKVLTAQAIAAAKSLGAAGIGFALTSARPPFGMRHVVAALGVTLPIAGFNGGLIVDSDGTVLERYPIDPQIAREAVKVVQDCGLDLWVYTETDWIVSDVHGPITAREAWIIDMDAHARPLTDADLDAAYKIVGVSNDHDKLTTVQERLTERFGDKVSATSSSTHFVDITHPRANKGAVVHFLADRLNIPATRIATIGDMANDVLMFEQSGFAIAMGNATPEVQARADVVTDTNEANGWATAVRRYLLPSAPDSAPGAAHQVETSQ